VPLSKRERLEIFKARLTEALPADNIQEAMELVARVLNAVEDEFSGAPYAPANWATDGRMYPPELALLREVEGRPSIQKARQVLHRTFFGDNGSIKIESRDGVLYLSKAGKDGREVDQL